MTPLGVGNAAAQVAFLKEHAAFATHLPDLLSIAQKIYCRTLARPNESQITHLLDLPKDHPQITSFEDKQIADQCIFYLGRVTVDDFKEIVVLSGNGLGIGSYKVLRGMYERIVHALYFDKHEEAARRFVRQGPVFKSKLAKRMLDYGIDVLSEFSAEEKDALLRDVADAKKDAPLLCIPDMAERLDDAEMLKLYGLCHLRPTIHIHPNALGMEQRLLKSSTGFTYNDNDYRQDASQALILAHNLLVRMLGLQDNRFHLGMKEYLDGCAVLFRNIWDGKSISDHSHD